LREFAFNVTRVKGERCASDVYMGFSCAW